MSPSIVADSVVNLSATIGIATAMIALSRRDPRGPLTKRLMFVLGVAAVLFLLRGIAWWSGSGWLDRVSLLPAASVPLGALVLTEGMLRRHAPRMVKIAALVGAILLGLLGAFGPDDLDGPYSVALSSFQLLGLATCAWLLARRDRTMLQPSENRGIGRLAFGALLVMPFIVTDFRVLAPNIPVRLGAFGALLVVTAVVIAGGGAQTRRQEVMLSAVRLATAALLGAAAACITGDVDAAQIMRFCTVAMSGVLTIGLMTDTLRAYFEAREPGVLNSVAASAAQSRQQLLTELARHPMFESAQRLTEDQLAAYDPALLRGFLSTRRVLRRSEQPWGLASSDPAVERMASLITAYGATHVVILSHDPIDLIAIAVPVIFADPATETALSLVRRLLALTPP
jgi:hypothetical protein